MSDRDNNPATWRSRVVLIGFALAAVGLVARAVDLQVLDSGFLRGQADARHVRVVEMPAHRGMITDRHGEPLAVSTPVDSVWVDPGELEKAGDRLPELAEALDLSMNELARKIAPRVEREFVYLKRRMPPEEARKVLDLGLPGVHLQREYKRYYPAGEVTSHVVGFTDIDDRGQEGLELAYDEWLSGTDGSKRVIRDRLGRHVANVESVQQPRPGGELTTSLDLRLQYLAYRELKSAVRRHEAESGSIVLLDPRSGEVLAMASQPAFNPNDRTNIRTGALRNRAVTDILEPGSSFKPFVIAAALEQPGWSRESTVDTAPGWFRVSGHRITDSRNLGRVSLTRILQKSSNVGAARVALSLEAEPFWSTLARFGFGSVTGSGFPGESGGRLMHHQRWGPLERATMAFGYGVSATPLQLAQAYAVLADDGIRRPVSFVAHREPPEGERVVKAATSRAVREMLKQVVTPEGTAGEAAVDGYHVAGKTGTVRKVGENGYSENHHVAVFAGMLPAGAPELVAVVVINEPAEERYYGGAVAAPVFARVAQGAARLLNIQPDEIEMREDTLVVSREGAS